MIARALIAAAYALSLAIIAASTAQLATGLATV